MESIKTLQKRPSDTELMPAPPPVKRIKRPLKVLPEEEYTAGLSHVIARDYFPGLLETEAKQDYLDALDAGDEQWMEDAGRRVKQVMTPGEQRLRLATMTPQRSDLRDLSQGRTPVGWVGMTPGVLDSSATPRKMRTRGSGEDAMSETKRENVKINTSLSGFQSKYTSEDNESFNKIMDRQNQKRRENHAWMWKNNKLPSKQQIEQSRVMDRIESEERQRSPAFFSSRNSGSNKDTALVKAGDTLENSDNRSVTLDSHKRPHNPRNQVFFPPDDVSETHPGLETQAEAQRKTSRAGSPGVNYGNTRLTLDAQGFAAEDEDLSRPPSPTISAVDAAIHGRPHPTFQRGGAYADSSAGNDHDDVEATPRVNGYAYVDEEPTAAELRAARGEAEPAEIEPPTRDKKTDHDALLNDLVRSDKRDGDESSGPNPFYIAEPSEREQLLDKVLDEQKRKERAKSDRLKVLKGQDIPVTPRFTSGPRVISTPGWGKTPGALTPAARTLFDRLSKTPKNGGSSAFRGEWTPRKMKKV